MTATAEERMLTPEIDAFIEKWKEKPGNLIMVLHRVQEEFGCERASGHGHDELAGLLGRGRGSEEAVLVDRNLDDRAVQLVARAIERYQTEQDLDRGGITYETLQKLEVQS